MAWHGIADKPLCEPMLIGFTEHIYAALEGDELSDITTSWKTSLPSQQLDQRIHYALLYTEVLVLYQAQIMIYKNL